MLNKWLPSLGKREQEPDRPATMFDVMEEFWRNPFAMTPWKGVMDKHPFFDAEGGFPALDVSENETSVTVKAELPGLDPKDVDLSLDGDVLTIKGEKKFENEEKKDDYHRIERSYGSFSRSVSLPAPVKAEGVKARFDKGVLIVEMTKDEAAKARKISIEG